ncbi:hypothetical protein L596_001239 [Steinernema carpocapsae]|uniref:Uncharacterized protein n=1 Tax=Steinernema carpocapsae TaxID=34508 RepID=A0A4U8UN63_STECR|nr:hypothetical protein L596_001239 [Steinernema carpocapsae]
MPRHQRASSGDSSIAIIRRDNYRLLNVEKTHCQTEEQRHESFANLLSERLITFAEKIQAAYKQNTSTLNGHLSLINEIEQLMEREKNGDRNTHLEHGMQIFYKSCEMAHERDTVLDSNVRRIRTLTRQLTEERATIDAVLMAHVQSIVCKITL